MQSPASHIAIDTEGQRRLRQPLLPLARMVHFLLVTGAADNAEALLAELPSCIETDITRYDDPATLLTPHLALLESLLHDSAPGKTVLDGDGSPLDAASARAALAWQLLLERELEEINSLLCAPCGCTLCCSGPSAAMQQQAFLIPLQDGEIGRFALPREDSPASRSCASHDELSDLVAGHGPPTGRLLHGRQGWYLALPRDTACPQLDGKRCRIYSQRPLVCRRPQIFPYLLESLPAEDGLPLRLQLRHGLRAVSDCPYVRVLHEDIATYAAACELTLYYGPNKG